jgi:hypothetical protein
VPAASVEVDSNLRCVSLTIEKGYFSVQKVRVRLTGSHCELDNCVVWEVWDVYSVGSKRAELERRSGSARWERARWHRNEKCAAQLGPFR